MGVCALLSLLWFLLIYRHQYPVAEFYFYLDYDNPLWSLYGSFYRPLSLGFIPELQYALFGNNGFLLQLSIAIIFWAVLFSLSLLFNAIALKQKFSFWFSIVFSFFVLANYNVISSLITQFTITDALFAAFYCLLLVSFKRIFTHKYYYLLFFSLIGMMLTKSFTVLIPFIFLLWLFICLLFEFKLVKQAFSTIVFRWLVFGVIVSFALYAVVLLILPTVWHSTFILRHSIDVPTQYGRANMEIFSINIKNCFFWLLQLHDSFKNSYVLNYQIFKDFTVFEKYWYSSFASIGILFSIMNRKRYNILLFHVLCLVFWVFFLSINVRVLNAYIIIPLVHVGCLSFLGWDFVTNILFKNTMSEKVVKSALLKTLPCVALLVISSFNMYTSSSILNSPRRDVSFHGSLSALDKSFRYELVKVSHQYDSYGICWNSTNVLHAFDVFNFHMYTTQQYIFNEYMQLEKYFKSGDSSVIYVENNIGEPKKYLEFEIFSNSRDNPYVNLVSVSDSIETLSCYDQFKELRNNDKFLELVNSEYFEMSGQKQWRTDLLKGQEVLDAHANSQARLKVSELNLITDKLLIEYGIADGAYSLGNKTDGVVFNVIGIKGDLEQDILFSDILNPLYDAQDQGVQQNLIDLDTQLYKEIIFETLMNGNSSWDWSYWSNISFPDYE